MNVHPAKMAEYRQVIAEIRAELGSDADEATVQDTAEGETDILDVVGALLEERLLCRAYAEAMDDMAGRYAAKSRNWIFRARKITDALGRLRDILGQNIKHPAGNVIVSVRKPAPEVSDDLDVADLAEEFVRISRAPDKVKMKEAFAAGRNVPGVFWGEAKRQVTIK